MRGNDERLPRLLSGVLLREDPISTDMHGRSAHGCLSALPSEYDNVSHPALWTLSADLRKFGRPASRLEFASDLDRHGFKLLLFELSIAMVPYLAICADAAGVPDTYAPELQLGIGLLVATLTIQLLSPAREPWYLHLASVPQRLHCPAFHATGRLIMLHKQWLFWAVTC